MKKFLALLLSLAMILSLSVPAFAAESKNVTANYTPSSTGGEDNAALVIGDNEISDGTTYTYTAEQDGTLYVTVKRLYWGVDGVVYEAYLNDWVAIYINGTAITKFANTVEVSDGDIVTVAMESLDDDSYHGTVNLSWEAPILAQITGVSIKVGETTYTDGLVTLPPDSGDVTITVTGTNLQNGTSDNIIEYALACTASLAWYGWTISDDGTSATVTFSASEFVDCTTAVEIRYCNDCNTDQTWIGSGIYVLYDDGNTTFYDVTVEASENGTVKAPPKSVENGQVFLTVIPDAGYQLGTLTVTAGDGTTINPSDWGDGTYFFTMPADNVTVTATFVPEDTDDTPAEITGVSITVDGTEYTSGQTAVITPDTNSIILTVTGTNLQNGTEGNYIDYAFTYSVPVTQGYGWIISDDGTSATLDMSSWKSDFEGCTTAFEIRYCNDYNTDQTLIGSGIYVLYDDGNTTFYDVTVEASENGTVKAPPKSAENGRVLLTVIPDAGYQLGTLTVTAGDTTINPIDCGDGTYDFTMPAGNVTVTATFVPDTTPTYDVTTNYDSTRGTVTVDKTTAKEGDTVTVTFTPEAGYVLFDWYAYDPDNSSDYADLIPGAEANTYTFTMPAHAVLVNGHFVKDGRAREDLYFNNGGNTDWTNVWAYFYTDTVGYIDGVRLTMAENGVYTLPAGEEIPNLAYKVVFDNGSNYTAIVEIPTGAENMFTLGTTTNEYDEYEGSWSVYTPSQPPTDVTSANIVWGSLAYTYTDGSGWANNDSSEDAGTVTVTNTGDTTIEVQPSYNPETGYTEITGSFGDNDSATLEAEESQTFTLTLEGKPKAAITAGTTIGSVTVTIGEAADPIQLHFTFVDNTTGSFRHSRHTISFYDASGNMISTTDQCYDLAETVTVPANAATFDIWLKCKDIVSKPPIDWNPTTSGRKAVPEVTSNVTVNLNGQYTGTINITAAE